MTITDEMVLAGALAVRKRRMELNGIGHDFDPAIPPSDQQLDLTRCALIAALSDQPKDDAHEWHMKPTTIPDEMFKRPMFVADSLRKMVANCVSLHAGGSSLYTDGERKAMLAAAEHIEAFVSAAPPPSSTAGESQGG